MFIPISNYRNLFVADYSCNQDKILKIVFSDYPNFSLNGTIIYPFAMEVETGADILVSESQHVKKLNHYVNLFGLPKKNIPVCEKEKQNLVIEQVKSLRKLRKI